jgi:hypothetical protein
VQGSVIQVEEDEDMDVDAAQDSDWKMAVEMHLADPYSFQELAPIVALALGFQNSGSTVGRGVAQFREKNMGQIL